jgi:hypothetical protein
MDNTGYRIAVARGLNVLEHVTESFLSDGTSAERDDTADRLLISETVRRAHRRTARRRLLVSRRS